MSSKYMRKITKKAKKPEGNTPSHTFHFLYLKHYELWFSKGKTQRERSENLFPNLPLWFIIKSTFWREETAQVDLWWWAIPTKNITSNKCILKTSMCKINHHVRWIHVFCLDKGVVRGGHFGLKFVVHEGNSRLGVCNRIINATLSLWDWVMEDIVN